MKAKILTCRVNISPYILMIEPNLQFLQSVNSVDSLKHVDSIKLSGCTKSTKEDNRSIAFSMFDDIHPLPKYQVTVDLSLGFSVSIYGWFLLDNHPIYLTHKRSVRFTRAFLLLSKVWEFQLCAGPSKFDSKIQDPVATLRLMWHSIPKNFLDFESSPAMQVMVYERHNSCLVISDTDQCSERQIADAAESKRLQHYCYCGMSCGHHLMIIIITTKELS